MKKYNPKPTVLTTVRISPEFHEACYKYHIRFSEAMRVGISVLLAERGVIDYDNKLNITRQLQEARQKAATYAQKVFDLEHKKEENKDE